MINCRNLIVDKACGIADLLQPWIDSEFQDFRNLTPIKDSIYVLGHNQFNHSVIESVRDLVERQYCHIVFSIPTEGSSTLLAQCQQLDIVDLIKQNKIILVSGGELADDIPCLQYDGFIPKIFEYEENLQAIEQTEDIFNQKVKPYKFLFLNAAPRASRKYLLERFSLLGLLDQSLWSNLIAEEVMATWPDVTDLSIWHNGQDLMRQIRPVQYLPVEYEAPQFQDHIIQELARPNSTGKRYLFDDQWGEIYLTPKQYVDTYFSVVTETVFEYSQSFRTEKIWKPIAMGHPWIAVANPGYYRDMHDLGFKTFGHVIDESFDRIQDHRARLDRIVEIVTDLCSQDLDQFLNECYTICKYNQQHLAEMNIKVRKEFPNRFHQFINERF